MSAAPWLSSALWAVAVTSATLSSIPEHFRPGLSNQGFKSSFEALCNWSLECGAGTPWLPGGYGTPQTYSLHTVCWGTSPPFPPIILPLDNNNIVQAVVMCELICCFTKWRQFALTWWFVWSTPPPLLLTFAVTFVLANMKKCPVFAGCYFLNAVCMKLFIRLACVLVLFFSQL